MEHDVKVWLMDMDRATTENVTEFVMVMGARKG